MPLKTLLNSVWIGLILLTLFTTLLAESTDISGTLIIFVCGVIAIKGALVIDYLMGLRFTPATIRYSVHAYFVVVPLIIALSMLYPELLEQLTTL